MSEKFLLVSLDEQKSKELAEVISNKTSRKILGYLSENEGTSSEISRVLEIPLSTVEYNINNLVKTGLVESDEFSWSPKGRKSDIYKVIKKYIVIAPGKSSELREALKKVLPIGLFGLVIGGVLEFFSRSKTLKVPLTKETITKTITTPTIERAVEEGAIASSTQVADSVAPVTAEVSEPIITVTSQVSEIVKDVVIPNPHYGLWFLLGLIVAVGLYVLFSLRKR